ncbi:hypothetical protein GCM10028784_39370 [Myceligenerans cantabricum]
MDTAIDQTFIDQIPSIVEALLGDVEDVPLARRQWVFYGSLPLGAGRGSSDLDAFLLHDGGSGHAAHRRDGTWGSTPVTIYVLSHDELADDGRTGRFGGYFALKLFSPFVSTGRESESDLADATARFLGPLSASVADGLSTGPRSWTSDQLLGQAYLAFLDLYPDFAGYIARLFRDAALTSRVWAYQRRIHVAALRGSGQIVPAGDGLWRYSTSPVADPDRYRSHCTARFWAFGAVCHDADPSFPDLYFGKTDAHAPQTEQERARSCLYEIAAGRGAR